MNRSSSRSSEENPLKTILETTFRERNPFEEIDDVMTTLMKENGIRMRISYFDQSQKRLKFVALEGQHGPERKRKNRPIKLRGKLRQKEN